MGVGLAPGADCEGGVVFAAEVGGVRAGCHWEGGDAGAMVEVGEVDEVDYAWDCGRGEGRIVVDGEEW